MKTIDFSYFIERYNSSEMSDAEKAWFRKELDGNEKLRKEVLLRKQTDSIVSEQNIVSLRNKLSEIEKKRASEVPQKSPGKSVFIRYAAVITLLAIIGSIALFNGKNLSSDEIIDNYYKTYQAPASQRSGSSVSNPDFMLALEFYNISDYAKAATLFNKVIENNPADMQSVLLSGVSNFEDKKYPEAKQSFVTVINDNNNLFIESAEWYLALCYVKTSEKEKALNLLKKVKDDGGIYSKDAKMIIRKLK